MRQLNTLGFALAALVGLSGAAGAAKSPVAPGTVYTGTIVKVLDGDTVRVSIPAFANTPFNPVDVRINGIDTPESHMPPAKCAAEVARGLAAAEYGRGLVKVGDAVRVTFHSIDKYGDRIDADLTLPDGRDWGTLMISGGYAGHYDGGTKQSWCPK